MAEPHGATGRRAAAAGIVLVVVALAAVPPAGSTPPASGLPSAAGLVVSLGSGAGCRSCGGPRAAAAAIQWQNGTAERLGALPPAGYGASLSYDPALGQSVLFGGCGAAACPSDETWTYGNAAWTNRTANLTNDPTAVFGGASDFDPNARAVVEFGGIANTTGTPRATNSTWEYSDAGWSRVATSCSGSTSPTNACLPISAWPAMAFDPAPSVDRTVAFGGCSTMNCFDLNGIRVETNATYWFDGTSGTWSFRPTAVGSEPTARGGAAMAYDPVAGGLVLFGGEGECGLAVCAENDTWLYANGTWSNVTSGFDVPGSEPAPRAFAAMTWDAAESELVLVGGEQLPSFAYVNETEALVCAGPAHCRWAPVASPTAPLTVDPALDTNSSVLDPMVVGGEIPLTGLSNATWVFSALPDLNVGVAPAPQSAGLPVYLNATAVGSTNETFVFRWGDRTVERTPDGDGVHVFPAPGVFNASVVVIDPNGSANEVGLQLFVHPAPAVVLSAKYPVVDVGVLDTFVAAPVLGSGAPPFNVTWSFGSGAAAYGPDATHAFPTPRNATVSVTIEDSHGIRGAANLTVAVVADPQVTILAPYELRSAPPSGSDAPLEVDAGTPSSLAAVVVGGVAPFNVTWSFGDGSVGYGLGPSHLWRSAGNETVEATVVDSGGNGTSGRANLTVERSLAVGIQVATKNPTARGAVTFQAIVAGGGGTRTVAWALGDGTVAAGALSLSHTYGAPGTYSVQVWVNDSLGSFATNTTNVTVASAPGLGSSLLEPGVLVGTVALVAVVVALAVVARRRRKASPPPPDDLADGP